MTELRYTWPEVFTNPDFQYDASDKGSVALALADGLEGWGLCSVDFRPETFGHGMVKIGEIAECRPTPEGITNRASDLGLLPPKRFNPSNVKA